MTIEVFDNLKKFAELADNNVLNWQILLGKKVIQIKQSREGKVKLVKHNNDVLIVNVVFQTIRGISSEDFNKKDFLEQFNLCSSIFIANHIKESLSTTIVNPTKEKVEQINGLLSKHEFSKAERFYKRECQDFITHDDYRKKEDAQKQLSIKKLHSYLEQYQFDEANDFYKNYCEGYIHHEMDYCKKKKECKKRFKDSLLSDLDILLSRYEYDEAEEFFHRKCIPFISIDEYKTKKSLFLQELTRIHQPLFEKLDTLLNEYSFDKADEFYNTQCRIYLPSEEYAEKRKFFWEKKKRSVPSELFSYFNENFLLVQDFYVKECRKYFAKDDYKLCKRKFVQSWVQEHLGNKADLEQAAAIGAVNSHIQVIARAGSGKTSTLVNRAIFLQNHCGIKPSEILLLAFNKKAAQEIRNRLQRHLQNDLPYALTFHALAYHLVHPDETIIFDEPDGQQTKSRSLQSVIDEFIRNPDYHEQIKSLMMDKFRDVWIRISEDRYNLSPEEMIEYRRSSPQIGIDGYNYKSSGEKIIADFLFEHDIPFKYEKNFWWKSINYHPDFTILKEVNRKKGIVIEYFGVQGDPNYDEQSEQKRSYWHDQSEYFFVEVNPQILKQHGRKGMENHLHDTLTNLGLQFNRLNTSEIWKRIKERAIDRFTKAMTNFIGRCRKQCLTPDQLSEKIEFHFASNPKITESEFNFLDLAQNFYSSYLDRLQETGEEDFDGLMQRAAKVVTEGNTEFLSSKVQGDLKNLKYIMIDEYQDFSLLFHKLITAIRKQNPEVLFLCVGDNWQGINSFAGADLHYYEKFTEIFKPSRILPITTNYRSASQIVEIGNKLMSDRGIPAKPSTQVQGKIKLVNIAKFQMTSIEEQEHGYDLTAAIIRLTGQLIQDGKQVVLLSKKNVLQGVDNRIKDLDKFRKYILKKLNLIGDSEKLVDISTTHKYKGKESQAVIILDAYNYPSIHPDSIFFRIFGDDENKLLEDDRRLFYVALTRAKEDLYIVTDSFKMSPFVVGLTSKMQLQELDWKNYPVPTTETRFITVKVSNQQGSGTNGTYNIRDLLKADGFRWDGTSKSWNKVEPVHKFIADGSLLQYLNDRNWISQANGIEVKLCNEQEEIIDIHLVNNSQYSSDNCISQHSN